MTDQKKTEIIGKLALVSQMSLIFIGKPHQVYTMWSEQTSAGVSIVMNSFIMIACVLYGVYGYRQNDKNIWLPQIPALFFMSIIFL